MNYFMLLAAVLYTEIQTALRKAILAELFLTDGRVQYLTSKHTNSRVLHDTFLMEA